ncbi:MAG TPA: exosortase-associated EpsI family protein [Tepidisphaeraceae bacterium]|nr:exosortase-associated EpsI family protein [Tepidisphaeraceae bacterium]
MSVMESKVTGVAVGEAGGGFRARGGFVVAVVVLLLAATGVRFSVKYLKVHIRKEPVPMRQEFAKAMPAVVGNWVRVADRTQSPEILTELAAQDWLFCSYVNAAALKRTPEQVLQQFAKLSYEEQEQRLVEYQRENPTAVLALALTYYTGKVDAVDHIAERCYLGGGWEAVDQPKTETWSVGDRQMDVRFLTFEHKAARSPVRRDVAYFFQVNGNYEGSHWGVRTALQNPFARYGYYAKVELASLGNDQATSAEAMRQFLTVALPKVESALPDWNQYKNRD